MDRELLKRCLGRQPGSWNEFVDRFLGLIYHVINHAAHLRSVTLRAEDVEDLASEVLLQIVANDYAVLRHFRMESSLATYLTVVARRICVQELAKKQASREVQLQTDGKHLFEPEGDDHGRGVGGLETLEEVARLLKKLPARERQVVRLAYLEGRSYEEISTLLSIPVNTIGPILSRAKKKLREGVKTPQRQAAPARRPAQPRPETD
jgi:RNA polymerase sigma-70 factor (ECF subfamily)